MANPKIRLTYLWTDPETFRTDLTNKASAEITHWTEEFFRNNEFDLEINPPADKRSSVDRASKFFLDKQDGIRPDFRERREIVRGELELMKRNQAQRQPLLKKMTELSARMNALRPRLASVPPDPDLARIVTQFDAISAEFQRVVERLSKLWEEYEEADARKDAKLVKADGYDYALRVRMMSKFLEDGIGTSTALNVVFCRSQRFPLTTLRMRRGRILGGHSGPLPLAVMFLPLKVFLWPHSYLVLDVDGNFPSTMAHEIIHAAGHDHPEDKVMKVATDRRVKGLQLGGGSIGLPLRGALWENARIEYEEVDVFEEVEGGFFDGAENDIMSYKLKKDALATKVVLRAEHKELLKNAFFVKQPRTP